MTTETKTKDFLEYPDGGVYMAIIELQEQEEGGCRWVLGERTEYDYHEHKGKHYLEVTEIGRQEEEK